MGPTPGLHGPSPGLLWGYPPLLAGSCVWSRAAPIAHAVPGPGKRTSAVGDPTWLKLVCFVGPDDQCDGFAEVVGNGVFGGE
jgi:hypothetical protein